MQTQRRAQWWWRVVGTVCFVLLCLGSTRTHAQPQVPDLETYEAWVREAQVAAQRGDRLGLDEIATELIATAEVVLPDGTQVPVDNAWLDTALDTADPDLPQIAVRLEALIEALSQPDSAAPDDAQQRLRDILSRPPFATAEAPTEGLWDQLIDWLLRQLDRLLEPIDAGAGVGRLVVWLIGFLGVALILVVLVYLLLSLRRSVVREVRSVDEDDPEAGLTANTALQQATNLAQGGDYRTAVRYLYLSSLLWLDERGLLRYDRALTNHEYLERLGNNAELHAHLAPIIDTFDRVWYGYATLDAESFAAYRRRVDELRRVRV